jgi:hypothetical protein
MHGLHELRECWSYLVVVRPGNFWQIRKCLTSSSDEDIGVGVGREEMQALLWLT